MRQSRLMSLVEALVNVMVGYSIGVAVLVQLLLFPVFGLTVTLRQNLLIGMAFTSVTSRRENPRVRVSFDVDVTTPLHLESLLAEISRHDADTKPMRLGDGQIPSRVRPAQR